MPAKTHASFFLADRRPVPRFYPHFVRACIRSGACRSSTFSGCCHLQRDLDQINELFGWIGRFSAVTRNTASANASNHFFGFLSLDHLSRHLSQSMQRIVDLATHP